MKHRLKQVGAFLLALVMIGAIIPIVLDVIQWIFSGKMLFKYLLDILD